MLLALLRSSHGVIKLLPALPKVWPHGKVTGLCARGGFVISMEWDDFQLKTATVLSNAGGPCTLQLKGFGYGVQTSNYLSCEHTQAQDDDGRCTMAFNTLPGKTYILTRS